METYILFFIVFQCFQKNLRFQNPCQTVSGRATRPITKVFSCQTVSERAGHIPIQDASAHTFSREFVGHKVNIYECFCRFSSLKLARVATMVEESSKGNVSGKGKGTLGVPPSMKGLGAKGWMLQKGMKGVKGKFQKGDKGLMKGKAGKGMGKSATLPSTPPAPPPESTSPSNKSPIEIPTTPSSSKPSPSVPDSTVPTTPASDGATPGSVEKKGDGKGPFDALMVKGSGKGEESGDGKERDEAGEEQAQQEAKDGFVHLRVVLCTCVFHILYSIAHCLEGHTATREREAMGGQHCACTHWYHGIQIKDNIFIVYIYKYTHKTGVLFLFC